MLINFNKKKVGESGLDSIKVNHGKAIKSIVFSTYPRLI